MPYKLIDHTADFGLHITAMTVRMLFSEAAAALFSQITNLALLSGKEPIRIDIKGSDWPDLMVNWLRELLYLWNGRLMLIKKVDIDALSETNLRATAYCDRFLPGRHPIKTEIKAVTYHQIQVDKIRTGWEAKIIFDV